MRPRSRSKVLTGTQELLGIEYQSPPVSDRSLTDRSGTAVLTGTETGPVPPLPTGTEDPLNGVRTSGRAGRGVVPPAAATVVSGEKEHAELKELPAPLLPLLPLPVTLYGASTWSGRGLYVCCERGVYGALVARRAVVYGVLEWNALLSAFMVGRANPASFAEWCECKAGLPTYKVTLLDAFGCVLGSEPPAYQIPGVGQLLDAWGIELRAVHYGKETPP